MFHGIKAGWMISLLTITGATVLPCAAQTTPPAGPGGAGGRATTRPAVTVMPPADAVAMDLAPPLDKTGNFKIAPKTTWVDVPPIAVKEGTPRGTVLLDIEQRSIAHGQIDNCNTSRTATMCGDCR